MWRRHALALVLVLAPSHLWAAPILVIYTITAPGTQASEAADSQPVGAFSDTTGGPGVVANAGMNSISIRPLTTGATPDLLHDAYALTITLGPGFELDGTELAFMFRSSPTEPDQLEVRTSLDAFASPFLSVRVPGASTSDVLASTTSPSGVGGVLDQTAAVIVRVNAFPAEDWLGTFPLGTAAAEANASLTANLEIGGDLSAVAVPEPLSLTLLAVGAAGLLTRHARRRRS